MRLLVLGVLAAWALADGKDEWPQYYGGPTHDNYRVREDPIRYPKLLWSFPGARGQPIVADGRVYAGGKGLYCIEAETGKRLAAYEDGADFGAAPALAGKLVIARRATGEVWAFREGLAEIAWKYVPPGGTDFAMPGTLAGDLYVFTSKDQVIALEVATGLVKWIHLAGAAGEVDMTPAVHDGLVYFGTRGGTFHALSLATGEVRWSTQGEGEFGWTSPVVAHGLVLVGDRGIRGDPKAPPPGNGRPGAVNAFDPATGAKKWMTSFGATGLSTPGVVPDGFLVGFGRSCATIDAKTGAWGDFRVTCAPNAFGSPTLVGKTVYFGNLDGNLYAYDRETQRLKWAFRVSGDHAQALDFTVADGRILLSSPGGLYALCDDGTGRDPRGLTLTANP